jgi:4,5:9,10-diseco-3-hydroxy-5,9,17-trioxoandrosta-1(10),2-diene-4-oate hydrolase
MKKRRKWLLPFALGTLAGYHVSQRFNPNPERQASTRQRLDELYDQALAELGPTVEGRYALAGDVNTHYVVAGPEDGPPVVLVHGAGLRGVDWRSTIPRLAGEGRRVYAPDLAAHGKSDAPVASYSGDYFVEWLDNLFDALGLERPDLVGLSLGGGIVLRYALSRPQRIRKLALVDAAGIAPPPVIFMPLMWAMHLVPVGSMMGLVFRIFGESEVAEQWGDYITAWLRDGTTLRRGLTSDSDFTHWVASEDELRSLEMPTLVAWGRHDYLFPVSTAERAADLIPNAQLQIFEEAGHALPLTHPDVFNRALVGFLAED